MCTKIFSVVEAKLTQLTSGCLLGDISRLKNCKTLNLSSLDISSGYKGLNRSN